MIVKLQQLLLLLSCYFFILFWQNLPTQQSKSYKISQIPVIAEEKAPQTNYVPMIDHGLRNKKVVALTFDADMTESMHQELVNGTVKSWYNKAVIDELIKTKTHATLFMTGLWVTTYPEITRSLANNNLFELSNHSYDHPTFFGTCFGLPVVPKTDYTKEINQTQTVLKQIAGVSANNYFRFPGGCYDNADLSLLKQLGLTGIGWDVVSGDSYYKNAKDIIATTLKQIQNGSIIVMHMHGGNLAPATAQALPTIIAELSQKGYKFVTIAELLGETNPPQLIKQPNLSENYLTPTQAVKLAQTEPFYYNDFTISHE